MDHSEPVLKKSITVAPNIEHTSSKLVELRPKEDVSMTIPPMIDIFEKPVYLSVNNGPPPSRGLDIDVNFEKLLLLIFGLLGIFLSILFIFSTAAKRHRRTLTNAFLYHSGLLDLLKSSFAIVFAFSIRPARLNWDHQGVARYEVVEYNEHRAESNFSYYMTPIDAYDVAHVCTLMGTSYIMIITVFIFNILAILCTEAFAFTDDNQHALISRDSSNIDEMTPSKTSAQASNGEGTIEIRQLIALHTARGINSCCVLFSLGMIYMGTLVIHLGPTIIAGQFDMDVTQDIFHCNLLGGEVRNFISFAMWLSIVCIAMASAMYYAFVFYRMIIANSSFRIANLLRVGVLLATRRCDAPDEEQLSTIVALYKNRARVLIGLIALTVICYYPLFLLMLCSLKITPQPFTYKIFRFLALSNPIFNSLLFLGFDNQLHCSQWCGFSKKSNTKDRTYIGNRRPTNERNQESEMNLRNRLLMHENDAAMSVHEKFQIMDNSTIINERVGQRLRLGANSARGDPELEAALLGNHSRNFIYSQNGKRDASPIPMLSPEMHANATILNL